MAKLLPGAAGDLSYSVATGVALTIAVTSLFQALSLGPASIVVPVLTWFLNRRTGDCEERLLDDLGGTMVGREVDLASSDFLSGFLAEPASERTATHAPAFVDRYRLLVTGRLCQVRNLIHTTSEKIAELWE